MARANLGQLLGNLGEAAPPPATNTPAATRARVRDTAVGTTSASPEIVVKQERTRTRVTKAIDERNAVTAVEDRAAPAYSRFVRKETRLREDQQNQLTLQARRLNRAKKTVGARITENSLIRVAVDLFLAQADRAMGDDEDAIRKSITP